MSARFCVLLLSAVMACGSQTRRQIVNPQSPDSIELSRRIAIPSRDGARSLAAAMPPEEVGAALKEVAGSERASVRMLVLELASLYPSEGASRAVLALLHDPDLTIQSVAGGEIARIAQKSLVPDMFKAMDRHVALPVKGALARQIGVIGDAGDIPRLRLRYRAAQDGGFRNDLSLAMARLGDEPSRQELIHRLNAADVTVRLEALGDVPYAGDSRLAGHLRPDLEDRRDASVISLPHEPTVAGRICDFAIQAMAGLGVKFSFSTVPIRRFTEPEIQEALQTITALEKLP